MRRTLTRALHAAHALLRRAPQFLEKQKEKRDATENATGDDMPGTPDSKVGEVDEGQAGDQNRGAMRGGAKKGQVSLQSRLGE